MQEDWGYPSGIRVWTRPPGEAGTPAQATAGLREILSRQRRWERTAASCGSESREGGESHSPPLVSCSSEREDCGHPGGAALGPCVERQVCEAQAAMVTRKGAAQISREENQSKECSAAASHCFGCSPVFTLVPQSPRPVTDVRGPGAGLFCPTQTSLLSSLRSGGSHWPG